MGSTAYGLATPSSDIDRLGVYIEPLDQVLKVYYRVNKGTYVHKTPDRTCHELEKYLYLAMQGNPTVLELLWLDSYETTTVWGEQLIALRHDLLSQRVRATYGGYALEQADRLMRRGNGVDFPEHRVAKHARHCFRLIFQLRSLLETGDIRVRLTDAEIETVRWVGELAVTDRFEFYRAFEKADASLKAIDPSILPEHPNVDRINHLLWLARLDYMTDSQWSYDQSERSAVRD